MLGAIIGDIVGSRFEFNNDRRKDFDFFTDQCVLTDDSIMTLTVAKAILMSQQITEIFSKNAVECMQTIGRCYPGYGYGDQFYRWILQRNQSHIIVMVMVSAASESLLDLRHIVLMKQSLSTN